MKSHESNKKRARFLLKEGERIFRKIMRKILSKRNKNSVSEFFVRSRYELLAALIIIAAVFIRLLGIKFGLPYDHYWDEPYVMADAINMMKTGNYNPHFFNYPSLYKYLELINSIACYLYGVSKGILISLSEIKTLFDTGWRWEISHPIFFLWGRVLTTLFGGATVLVVYLLGEKLKDGTIALLAALFLAFAPGHVYYSKVIATDVPMAFFAVSTVYLSVLYYQQRKTAFFILAGLFAGLTAATKYNGGVIVFVPLLAAIFVSFDEKQFTQKIFLIIMFFSLGFLVACPYSLLDLPHFLTGLGNVVRQYKIGGRPGRGGEPGLPQLFHYLRYFYEDGYGPILTILAGVGFIFGMFRIKKKLFFLLLVFPVAYMILMCSQKLNYVRNMMCVIPLLAIFSSLGFLSVSRFIFYVLKKLRKGRWLTGQKIFVAGLLIVAIVTPFSKSIKKSWDMYNTKETRVVATEWLAQNLPEGSRVLFMSQLHFFMPHISGMQYETVVDDKLGRPIEWYLENNIDYIVTSDAGDDLWLKDKSLVKQFNNAFISFSALKIIPGTPLSLSVLSINPTVKIMQVPKVPIALNKRSYSFNVKSFRRIPSKITYDSNSGVQFFCNGEASSYLFSLSGGTYRLLITAMGTPALGIKPIMRVDLLKVVGESKISVVMHDFNVKDTFKEYAFGPMDLGKGNYRIEISFTNDLCIEKDGIIQDRNLFVKDVALKRL